MRVSNARGRGIGWGWLSVAGFLSVLMPRFGGENPLGAAPNEDNWHHEGLSRRAAREAGWSREAENALAFHTDYLDSYLYNPLWWFNVATGGGLERTRLVLSSQHELIKLHFDDLFAAEQVHVTWQRYLSGTVAGLLWIGTSSYSRRTQVSLAHNIVGASLHAMQDFYSHSNWIDDAGRRERTWFDVPAAERVKFGLWTGSYEVPDHLGHAPHGDFLFACTLINNLGGFGRSLLKLACHAASPLAGSSLCMALRACDEAKAIDVPEAWRKMVPEALQSSLVHVKPGINVDSRWLADIGAEVRAVPGLDGETAFTTAYDLAARTSTQWLHCLETLLTDAGFGDLWKDVKRLGVSDRDYLTDTVAWEDLALLPYRFLSAGPYPPPPGQDDTEAWYLRVTIATADVEHAGTDADIVPFVDGERYPELDHAPPPKPPAPGEPPQIGTLPSVLSHDDFERGSTASYVIGPLTKRPTSLALLNDAPSTGAVILAALTALLDAIASLFASIGNFFLSLVGYHADFVDDDHQVAGAAALNALAVGSRIKLDLDCNGGSEGHYRVDGYIEKTAVTGVANGIPWREYVVAATKLRCIEESAWDRGSNSDEPFVLGLFIPHGGTGGTQRWIRGPYVDVDSGENRDLNVVRTLRVPQTYGAISVAVAVYESDDESQADRTKLLDQFANTTTKATAAAEQAFLVTLAEAIASGWRPSWVDAVAFRRGRTVEVCRYPRVSASNWLAAGEKRTWTLGTPSCVRVEVGETCASARGPRQRLPLPTFERIDPTVVPVARPRRRLRFDVGLQGERDVPLVIDPRLPELAPIPLETGTEPPPTSSP
jgi:hypothetical protein